TARERFAVEAALVGCGRDRGLVVGHGFAYSGAPARSLGLDDRVHEPEIGRTLRCPGREFDLPRVDRSPYSLARLVAEVRGPGRSAQQLEQLQCRVQAALGDQEQPG